MAINHAIHVLENSSYLLFGTKQLHVLSYKEGNGLSIWWVQALYAAATDAFIYLFTKKKLKGVYIILRFIYKKNINYNTLSKCTSNRQSFHINLSLQSKCHLEISFQNICST